LITFKRVFELCCWKSSGAWSTRQEGSQTFK
jgi:hypothetical protein